MAPAPELRKRPAGVKKPRDPPPAAAEMRGQVNDVWDLISAILADLNARMVAITRELGLDELKPWKDFFAHFKPPRAWTLTVVDERVTTNFLNYRGNYAVVALGFVALGIAMHITTLFAMLVSGAYLSFLFPVGESTRVVRLGERELSWSERLAAAVVGVGCILGLSGAWYVLLFYGGTGFFLCTLHAIFRPRTLRSKANRLAKDVKAGGGFSIEGAQTFVERALNITPTEAQ